MERLNKTLKLFSIWMGMVGFSIHTYSQAPDDPVDALQDQSPPHVGRYYHLKVPPKPQLSQVDPNRLKTLLARFTDVDIQPPTRLIERLDPSELRALVHLLRAAETMNDIYLLQQDSGVAEFVRAARRSDNPDLVRFVTNTNSYAIPHGGTPQAPDADSLIPGMHPSDGGNMYPAGFTKEGIETAIELQDRRRGWWQKLFGWGKKTIDHLRNDRQSLVRMSRRGHLTPIPYSVAFESQFSFAAEELREAATLLKSKWPKFALYLEARADAFETNDYEESDRRWMFAEPDCPFDIVIGPTESYQDKLLGIREQASAFVILTDPELRRRYQPLMEQGERLDALLPVPHRDQVGKKVYNVRLVMGYEIYRSGDGHAGIQGIAYNLPNNAEIRNREGFKMTLLKNLIDAKAEKILKPLARLILAPEYLHYIDSDAFGDFIFLHEYSHGLGPGTIKQGAKEEKVQNRLGKWYHGIEELKADISGTYLALEMIRGTNIPRLLPVARETFWVTYVVGLFRSIRFGVEDSHAESNVVQLQHALRTGGLVYDETSKRFHINFDKLEEGVQTLTAAILGVEANPEPDIEKVQANAKAFLEGYQSKVVPPFIQAMFQAAKEAGVADDLRTSHPTAERLLHFPLTDLRTKLPRPRFCAAAP